MFSPGSRGPVLISAILLTSTTLFGGDFYVSPNGSSGGNGSIGSPWDIATSCAAPAAVRPGDTVWLRGGAYGQGGTKTINCSLGGSSSSPVIVRNYNGERATIFGGLGVYGNYAWYW